ncbi:MAG: hypothetical protein ACR2M7_05820 [Bdellovibrionales bacterium]
MKIYETLRNQLIEFGLNPRHWEIQKEGSSFKLNHLKDRHLKMVGAVFYKNQRLSWSHLEILSF